MPWIEIAVGVGIALLVGAVAFAWQAREARHQRDTALAAQHERPHSGVLRRAVGVGEVGDVLRVQRVEPLGGHRSEQERDGLDRRLEGPADALAGGLLAPVEDEVSDVAAGLVGGVLSAGDRGEEEQKSSEGGATRHAPTSSHGSGGSARVQLDLGC